MNKGELERAIADRLRSNNIRKHILTKRDVFYIRKGDGQEVKFEVAPTEKDVIYTREDVSQIIKTMIEIIHECI